MKTFITSKTFDLHWFRNDRVKRSYVSQRENSQPITRRRPVERELARHNSPSHNVTYVNSYNNHLRNFHVKCKLRHGWSSNKASKFWTANKFSDKREMTVKRYFFVFTTNKIIALKGPCVLTTLAANLSQITVFTCFVRRTTRKQDVCKHQI